MQSSDEFLLCHQFCLTFTFHDLASDMVNLICILYLAYRILYGDEDVHVLGLDYYLTQYTGPCPFRPKIASEARNQPEDPAGLP